MLFKDIHQFKADLIMSYCWP